MTFTDNPFSLASKEAPNSRHLLSYPWAVNKLRGLPIGVFAMRIQIRRLIKTQIMALYTKGFIKAITAVRLLRLIKQ